MLSQNNPTATTRMNILSKDESVKTVQIFIQNIIIAIYEIDNSASSRKVLKLSDL